MEELSKIMSVVAEYMNIQPFDILTNKTNNSQIARKFMCHLIRDSYDFSLWTMTDMSYEEFYQEAEEAEHLINTDDKARVLMNMIRVELGLKPIKIKDCNINESNRCVSATMQLFGFDYTEEENKMRKRFLIENTKWFEKNYGSLGVKPLKDGCVYTRR